MNNNRNNNHIPMQEYPFDYERYINEQLRQIDDLDERRFAKEILLKGLGSIIRQTEQKYMDLEKRIYEEIEIPDSQYSVVSTVIERRHYDPTNETLFPVDMLDLQEETQREQLSDKKLRYVRTVFVRGNNRLCRSLEETGNIYGSIMVGAEKQRAEFVIRPAQRYRNKVEQLYQMFLDNYISWKTVNTAYLDKFYDLYMAVDEAEKVHLENDNFMEEIEFEWGEYAGAVLSGIIPLWNIEELKFESTNFMIPCIDGIYYEHEFRIEEEKQKDGYLIQKNGDILEIRHENGRIMLKSPRETFSDWVSVRLVQGEMVRSLDYKAPFLSNREKDTFLKRLTNQSGVRLMTKSDLFRRVLELDVEEYIELVDCAVLDGCEREMIEPQMNWFAGEELFPRKGRSILLLSFREKEQGYYLNDSMAEFVVSRMQMEMNEYRCAGELRT